MEEVIISTGHSVAARLKVWRRLAIPLTLVLGTCIFVLTGKPYISIPGNRVVLEVPSFRHCVVAFHTKVLVKDYGVWGPRDSSGHTPIASTPMDAVISELTVANTYYGQSGSDSAKPCTFEINTAGALETEISAISVDDRSIDLKFAYKQNLKSVGAYVRFRYIRKVIADSLFSINDSASNWLLTFMWFGTVWLVGYVCLVVVRAYLYSDEKFDKYLARLMGFAGPIPKTRRRETFDRCSDQWKKWDMRFKYLQALGPAVGFILTVSSLVQALNPASLGSNDLDAFMRGIHVAMISTFLGLLLRIVALEGARVNLRLLGRVDSRLVQADTLEVQTGKPT